jgi:hypothetical protein
MLPAGLGCRGLRCACLETCRGCNLRAGERSRNHVRILSNFTFDDEEICQENDTMRVQTVRWPDQYSGHPTKTREAPLIPPTIAPRQRTQWLSNEGRLSLGIACF